MSNITIKAGFRFVDPAKVTYEVVDVKQLPNMPQAVIYKSLRDGSVHIEDCDNFLVRLNKRIYSMPVSASDLKLDGFYGTSKYGVIKILMMGRAFNQNREVVNSIAFQDNTGKIQIMSTNTFEQVVVSEYEEPAEQLKKDLLKKTREGNTSQTVNTNTNRPDGFPDASPAVTQFSLDELSKKQTW